jgi:putative RecB family exonuclease
MSRIALSWSRLSDYNQCPLKFKLKYIEKEPMFKEDESASPHLVRGSNVHKALENYVLQKQSDGQMEVKVSSLPEVERAKGFVDRFLTNYQVVIPETQIAVNDKWERVEWFSSEAYYRVIMDLIAINPSDVQVIDYKTGKIRDYDGGPSGKGQLHLSGAVSLCLWPEIPEVRTTYAYVDHGQTLVKKFTQDDKKELVDHFDAEHAKVNSDKDFKPKVNEFCKWCPATRKHCPYSRKL